MEKDIYRSCRLCYDNIGEGADISCGDAWCLDENGQISFDERTGRKRNIRKEQEGSRIPARRGKEWMNIYREFKNLLTGKAAYEAMSGVSNPYGDDHDCKCIANILVKN